MRSAAILIAAVALLSGCGADAPPRAPVDMGFTLNQGLGSPGTGGDLTFSGSTNTGVRVGGEMRAGVVWSSN